MLTNMLTIGTFSDRRKVSIMSEIRDIFNNMIPISMFNRGMAGQIFADVKAGNKKVVIKNNVPECVLISPEEYVGMIDELEDAKDALLAYQRDKDTEYLSDEQVMKNLGMTEADLDGWEDVEIG